MARTRPVLGREAGKRGKFMGRVVVRVLDLKGEPQYPHKRWNSEAIGRWLVTSGINPTRPYKKKRNWLRGTITFRQRQGAPAERIYVAQCELP